MGTALVTGGTGGIGYHTALGIAATGSRVVVTGRDRARGRAVAAAHDALTFIPADHATVHGNEELAQAVGAVDLLVNNVGGIYGERWETTDGYEGTLAMNLIGPAALTAALRPTRIVNVMSGAAFMWNGDPFADLHSRNGYVGIHAYVRAKFLNACWTAALARAGVRANAVNPGRAWTPSTQAMTPDTVPAWRDTWDEVRADYLASPAEDAARSSIWMATAPEAAELRGAFAGPDARLAPFPPEADDEALGQRILAMLDELIVNARV